MTAFDVIIVGGGPGGYILAIRAAQLGFSVLCIDKRPTLGGTCLNVGCIPSKALLASSAFFEKVRLNSRAHGVILSEMKIDLDQMMQRKNNVVKNLTKGIDFLFRKNKITRAHGVGKLLNPQEVQVTLGEEITRFQAHKAIVVATGAQPITLDHIAIDERCILSSTGALSLSKIPERMLVVGGGYIGLEMGSVWRRLGTDVTVIEVQDRIVPAMDHELGEQLRHRLESQGLKFRMGAKVEDVSIDQDRVTVYLRSGENFTHNTTQSVDALLLCLGRRPFTTGLGLENLDVTCNSCGQIVVNSRFETNIPGVYAIGDVIPGPMLAHKAEKEGIALAEILAGQSGHVNYDVIPSVIYTEPEVASVGLSEEEAQRRHIPYRVGKFPFSANSRSQANGWTEGWVKMISHEHTDRILGTHILGPEAGTLIGQAALAQEFGASSEDVARTCHAHPTLNEALKEAALSVMGRTLHF